MTLPSATSLRPNLSPLREEIEKPESVGNQRPVAGEHDRVSDRGEAQTGLARPSIEP